MNELDKHTTAYQCWDERWTTESGRKDWIKPEADVIGVIPFLKDNEVKQILDLGCGVGRHAILLAEEGFQVSACDASLNGLEETQRIAKEKKLSIGWQQCFMTQLPYPDSAFDYVLSWNVIYHGTLGDTRQAIDEILRVLKPNGYFQGTFLTKRNVNFQKGVEVSKDTYSNPDDEEKAHPHNFCNAIEACELLHDFEILSLSQHEHKYPDSGSWHWHYLAQAK